MPSNPTTMCSSYSM